MILWVAEIPPSVSMHSEERCEQLYQYHCQAKRGYRGCSIGSRVAIVKFMGDKTNKVGNDQYKKGQFWYNNSQVMKGLTDCSGGNVKVLEDTVAGIKPSGATRADYGLELAGDITLAAQMPRRSLCSLPTAFICLIVRVFIAFIVHQLTKISLALYKKSVFPIAIQ